ncbi:MAG: 23S rRNA (adenine(2503)-C(2))-methyltransferase RlmN [Bacteroidales bacterium]|nr:23S rRNA (adenine(2503)-C(2))-methyltransferase RlmN [Bacteroidales bacterium]
MKEKLLGKTPDELKKVALDAGLPAFASKQIASWLYEKRVSDFESMSNISKAGREKLGEMFETGVEAPIGIAESFDGTKKYLFRTGESAVEAVMIPSEDRFTLCVSSQAGCKMGCRFCMTGRQGFHGNLSTAEILNQFISIPESASLTNAVFMGMGEPLDNFDAVMGAIRVLTAPWGFAWSPKRITLSTIGVIPQLKRYLDECNCHLAVSLHNPIPEERLEMMPVQKAYDILDVVDLVRQYDFSGQRRVSFEYTMFSGWNDSKRHADALIRLLRGLECRVNLIRFHEIPDFPYRCASAPAMEQFRDRLNNNGITCTIRASRGEDILAACGMLAGRCSNGNR